MQIRTISAEDNGITTTVSGKEIWISILGTRLCKIKMFKTAKMCMGGKSQRVLVVICLLK